jgi:hypothetical protein
MSRFLMLIRVQRLAGAQPVLGGEPRLEVLDVVAFEIGKGGDLRLVVGEPGAELAQVVLNVRHRRQPETQGDLIDVAARHLGETWRDDRPPGHRIWTPSAGAPIDLEKTVEAWVFELQTRMPVTAIVYDPYQMARTASTFKAALLPTREFPQTMDRITAMSPTLWDLLTGRNLILYPAGDLRQHAVNTVAIEGRERQTSRPPPTGSPTYHSTSRRRS